MCQQSVAAEREFAHDLRAPKAARRFVRSSLCRHLTPLADEAELLVSELVTNAVSYARAPVLVQVECVDAHRLLVSVSDGSADFVQRSRASEFEDSFVGGPADLSESGRGLRLLRDFAATWGVRTSSSGKSIWFELWMT